MSGNGDWERINAYVDGELSAEEAEALAEQARRRPELARRIALLHGMKTAVAATARAPAAPRRPSTSLRLALAAALAMAVLGLALLWQAPPAESPPGRDDTIALAVRLHQRWLQEWRAGAAAPAPAAFAGALAPDLSELGLRPVRLDPLETALGPGLHVGYLGRRGCTVSLVMVPARGPGGAFRRHPRPEGTVYSWRIGGHDYYLVAAGMDPKRLAQVAAVVRELTRRGVPLRPEMLLAFERARASSRPCRA